jgi:hypothetical protein
MEFLHASIALLASMVLVLAGMVGWLYWQQTRIFQNMNSIVMVIGELARPAYVEPAEEESPTAPPSSPEPEKQEQEEDDRVSVEEQEEGEGIQTVDGPMDTDNLDEKTTKKLRELLTKRGIPFGKRDNKTALISLLKATS